MHILSGAFGAGFAGPGGRPARIRAGIAKMAMGKEPNAALPEIGAEDGTRTAGSPPTDQVPGRLARGRGRMKKDTPSDSDSKEKKSRRRTAGTPTHVHRPLRPPILLASPKGLRRRGGARSAEPRRWVKDERQRLLRA